MRLPSSPVLLYPRQERATQPAKIVLYVLASSVVGLMLVASLLYYFNRWNLVLQWAPLPNGWHFWKISKKPYSQIAAHDRPRGQSLAHLNHGGRASAEEAGTRYHPAATSVGQTGVDRGASVRSVMTLPAYSKEPKESELVIGREGERSGVDTVVEYPEPADEEETRRDEEMESLYQIRLTRRREAADRERHRQERREARRRGDWVRLEELRAQSRLRANDDSSNELSSAIMLAEHQSLGRESRVSSVSYADVGQVHHDGSRIRANSQESERSTSSLLNGGAPMGGREDHNRTASGSSSFPSALHTRDRSASSLSISTAASDLVWAQAPQMPPTLAARESRSATSRRSRHGSESLVSGVSDSSPPTDQFATTIPGGSDDNRTSSISQPLVSGTFSPPSPNSHDTELGEAPAYPLATVERDAGGSPHIRASEAPELPGHSISHGVRDNMPTRIPSRAPRLPHIPRISVEGATAPNTPSSPVPRSDPFNGA